MDRGFWDEFGPYYLLGALWGLVGCAAVFLLVGLCIDLW